MQEGLGKGVFPGASLWVGFRGQEVHKGFYGNGCVEPKIIPLQSSTKFDWASLTKPLATTCVVMSLVAKGEMDLKQPVGDWVPKITLQHLVEHSSGLPVWQPYYRDLIPPKELKDRETTRDYLLDRITQESLLAKPGTKRIYSDLGFILLQIILERHTKKSLDQLFQERVVGPLQLSEVRFELLTCEMLRDYPLAEKRLHQFAATEFCPWRKRLLVGEVHDDHAALLGGVAGHAGLFGTLEGAASLVQALVRAYKGNDDWLPSQVVRDFLGPHRKWPLGWDRPALKDSQAGKYFSENSVGHLGFTGCSVWIDWEKDWQVVLLTNRVHPTHENEKIKEFRPELHDVIYETITKKN